MPSMAWQTTQPLGDACREFARRLVANRPDRLFLVSPHSPRERRAFGLWSGERLRGDLGSFGAPGAAVDLPNDREAIEALERVARKYGTATGRTAALSSRTMSRQPSLAK